MSETDLDNKPRTVTKLDLANDLVAEHGISRKQALAMVQTLLDRAFQHLTAEGTTIQLRDFGVMGTKLKPEKWANNPQGGDKVFVPARNVFWFRPSPSMTRRLNDARFDQGWERMAAKSPEELQAQADAADTGRPPLPSPPPGTVTRPSAAPAPPRPAGPAPRPAPLPPGAPVIGS